MLNPCIIDPIDVITLAVWVLSSRVGDKHRICVVLLVILSRESAPIVKAAVLPVPDCACAITSRPFIKDVSDLRWIGLGFSNP